MLSAILPVVAGRTEYRNSRRMAINSQLQRMCDMEEVGFVDVWCRFVERQGWISPADFTVVLQSSETSS